MLGRTAIATLFALLAATAAHAQAPKNDANAAVREIVRLSGAERQLQTIASQARTQLRERHAGLPENTRIRIDTAIGAAFAPKTLHHILVQGVEVRFDQERAAVALRWLRSPQGRRASRLDEAAAGPEMAQELSAYVARLRTTPPAPQRLRLTQRLEAATGAVAFTVELVTGMFTAMAGALDPVLPANARLKPGELDSIVADMRRQLEPTIREAILVTLLFTYRSLGEAELAEVVRFYESDAGQWYTTATGQALLDVMSAAASRLAVEIAAAR